MGIEGNGKVTELYFHLMDRKLVFPLLSTYIQLHWKNNFPFHISIYSTA